MEVLAARQLYPGGTLDRLRGHRPGQRRAPKSRGGLAVHLGCRGGCGGLDPRTMSDVLDPNVHILPNLRRSSLRGVQTRRRLLPILRLFRR
jgi:hypothetical protein